MLLVSVIDSFVNEEVELHGMQPVHGFVIETVKHFGNADVKFSGFGSHCWRWRESEEKWWWWWWKREERSGDNRCRGRWSGDPGNGEGGGEVVG